MKGIILFIVLFLSMELFAQKEVTGIIPTSMPNDRNGNIVSVLVTFNPDSGKYYYYDADKITIGYYGSTLITGTAVVIGNFFAMQVLEDAVIDSLVDSGRSGDAVNGLSLTAGIVIYGQDITRIKLTSGKVLAYKKD